MGTKHFAQKMTELGIGPRHCLAMDGLRLGNWAHYAFTSNQSMPSVAKSYMASLIQQYGSNNVVYDLTSHLAQVVQNEAGTAGSFMQAHMNTFVPQIHYFIQRRPLSKSESILDVEERSGRPSTGRLCAFKWSSGLTPPHGKDATYECCRRAQSGLPGCTNTVVLHTFSNTPGASAGDVALPARPLSSRNHGVTADKICEWNNDADPSGGLHLGRTFG
jgi:hypothetical protein